VLNACELKIDLFCSGLRVPDNVSLAGARGIAGAHAGLGSGLEVSLPTASWVKRELWVNVPVEEPFARLSAYVLGGSPVTGYWIRDDRSGDLHAAHVPREPNWYRRLTSRDLPMSCIGALRGTCLSVYLNPACAFWNYQPALNCRFCASGRASRSLETSQKTLEDVVETCWAAKEESGVTFVELNGGFQGSRGIAFAEPFIRAIKQDVGVLVGVQLAPDPELARYDRIIGMGVDHLSFCMELVDAEWFARICPGKARTFGQRLFLDAMEYCAARLPHGAVSGAIIAGIEPVEHTIEGIDRIVSAGASPAVCVFRPAIGSEMADWPPPTYAEMRRVMAAMYETCRRHRLPIGIAPRVDTSLIVNADDAALLAPRTAGFYAYELWRRGLRIAAWPAFAARQQARPRRISVERPPGIGA
jgi:hypothetical protein